MSVAPTSSVTFLETEHGRLRRAQRGIDKKDLQAAQKYGERRSTHPRPNGDKAVIYSYKDITYIVNEVTGEEVTSYATPLKLEQVNVTPTMLEEHREAQKRIKKDLFSWTSNTVIVVDTSGSMGKSDMWGTRHRLGAVWVSLALDFVAHRIETGGASMTDVVSIVTLSQKPVVMVKEWPCTWVLYNRIVQAYNSPTVCPYGHGPFIPSLNTANELLTRNPSHSCALSLVFLTDGRPSDQVNTSLPKEVVGSMIFKKSRSLARRFGRRYTFTAVGIGDYDDFEVLEKMVEAAKEFGANATFELPSMTSSSLGEVFTSVASSVTTMQSEMTDIVTGRQCAVRDVTRESRRKANEALKCVNSNEFWIYPIEKVVRTVYEEWYEGRDKNTSFTITGLQNEAARYVAMAKGPFGEGVERFAFRFFELAEDGQTIVGKPLVAKESRLLLSEDIRADETERKKFVRTFCSTQQLARRLAGEFNEKLEKTHRVDKSTPQVAFLNCSVYQLDDKLQGKTSVLVEEKLDHEKWYKWNANNGFVEGMTKSPEFDSSKLRAAITKLDHEDLGMIAEGSDEEDEEHTAQQIEPKVFSASEVAQAFSHFTYWATGRKRLVCDLQGVFDAKDNLLKLSDPVIHYYHCGRSDRRFVHGRTDRGRKGIAMFFETHECGHLCLLMLRGFRRARTQGKPTELGVREA